MILLKNFKDFQNLSKFSIGFIYLFVNSLFIFKYGGKFVEYVLPLYLILITFFLFIYLKIKFKKNVYKWFFIIFATIFFISVCFVNYFVDGNSLNVDRWSAMEVGIKAILNNQYPYNIPDFLGRESSNLPTLIILGMPFYLLLESVGYLQAFVFLLFAFLFFKIFDDYKQRFLALVILIFSPSYLWEIYVKSDLFSNFVLLVFFLLLSWKYIAKNEKFRTIWLPVFTALIFLTRLSVVIPLLILLFKPFICFSIKQKLIFVFIFSLINVFILSYFFHNAQDFQMIVKYNPFTIQGGKQPLFLSLLFVFFACLVSFKVKNFLDIAFWSAILFFSASLLPFLLHLKDFGWKNVFINSYFDVNFFNMSMPFVIISFVLLYKNKFIPER
ncbi:hypothetical protein [Frigoriflavimonas asaccharolytica]|uniref:Uncharacterized protein n=1 Tax=Frigoriflavimonas asaccharolytica TaxID=2735899 RepID=A0A8J8K473_9FLAO|nr:hypothetical protein [Frigoriflavimonas asaccharolytica]NRS91395.1 hypothetical protein [Frigoriflavimonas asaccharolytica]